MTFAVVLSDRAGADLENLPGKIHRQVITGIRGLQARPFPDGKRIKKLRGFKEDLYRLRSGDYRVVFQRQGRAISIVRILGKEDFMRIYG